jgi:hypothetical protein
MMRARLKTAVTNVMSQGLSPQKLALSVSIGASLGILPVIWGTSVVCSLLAMRFRLNHLCVQAVNYLVYPLQLALLLPFYRMGAWIFRSGPSASAEMLGHGIGKNFAGELAGIVVATIKAVAAWLLIAPVVAAVLYFTLVPIFARMSAARPLVPQEPI